MKRFGRVIGAVAVAVMMVVAVGLTGCDGDNGTGGGNNNGGNSTGGNNTGGNNTGGNNTGGNDVTVVDPSTVVRDTFTDRRDSKVYKTVKIGTQTWMAENLNFRTDSSWCYDDSAANCAKYGRLYVWSAAMSACPSGWTLPDSAAWNRLALAVGGSPFLKGDDGYYVAGGKLKSTSGWMNETIDGGGTDNYGFSALPGGARYCSGGSAFGWFDLGTHGNWWTSSEGEDSYYFKQKCHRDMVAFEGSIGAVLGGGVSELSHGYSVRCIKIEWR